MTQALDEAMKRAAKAMRMRSLWPGTEMHVDRVNMERLVEAIASLAASGFVLVPVTVISQPNEPGQYVGDTWFGHPQDRTLPTHWWDGNQWVIDHSPAAPKPGDGA